MRIEHLFYVTGDNYDYLINGAAMSEMEAFIANEESTYEQYIEVHTCTVFIV